MKKLTLRLLVLILLVYLTGSVCPLLATKQPPGTTQQQQGGSPVAQLGTGTAALPAQPSGSNTTRGFCGGTPEVVPPQSPAPVQLGDKEEGVKKEAGQKKEATTPEGGAKTTATSTKGGAKKPDQPKTQAQKDAEYRQKASTNIEDR